MDRLLGHFHDSATSLGNLGMNDIDNVHSMLLDLAGRTSAPYALAVCRVSNATQHATEIVNEFLVHAEGDCELMISAILTAMVSMHIEAEARALGVDGVQLTRDAIELSQNIKMALIDGATGLH